MVKGFLLSHAKLNGLNLQAHLLGSGPLARLYPWSPADISRVRAVPHAVSDINQDRLYALRLPDRAEEIGVLIVRHVADVLHMDAAVERLNFTVIFDDQAKRFQAQALAYRSKDVVCHLDPAFALDMRLSAKCYGW